MTDPSDVTVQTYRENFEKYVERTPQETLGEFKEWIDLYSAQLPEGALILELGSASGRDARYFAAKGFTVICTDVIQEALRRLSSEGFETEEFDFRDAPKPEWIGRFDGVFANAVLLHAPPGTFEFALGNIARMLKPGGILGLTLKLGAGEEITREKVDAPRYFKYYSEQDVREIMTGLSFTVLSTSIAERGKWLHVIAKVCTSQEYAI